jgi:membrane-bound lytic murein transglycosylase A
MHRAVRPRAGHRRRLKLALVKLALGVGGLVGLLSCAPPAPVEPVLGLQPVAFDRLEGWAADDPSGALLAFRRSCSALRARAQSDPMGPEPAFGQVGDWLAACAAADAPASLASAEAARDFFESWFQPYRVSDHGDSAGLFTGYYEPVLHGSRHEGGPYQVPLHAPPGDLLRIDLGRFNPQLAGYAIWGRVAGSEFVPYYSRAEIDDGALAGRDLVLLWVDDPIAKFFLQIQGSGQVRLDDGSVVRVGYAAQNGRPYRAIGRDLIEIGALAQGQVTLQTIRAWLRAHPADAATIMERNPSYIFFQEHPELAADDGPLGSEGVPLTAGRSLAVDRRFLPLGAPVWLDTTAPRPDRPEHEAPLRRLLIAQDTGGAIKGVVRGDVFWGAGDAAEAIAGRMQAQGRLALLLPKALVPTS